MSQRGTRRFVYWSVMVIVTLQVGGAATADDLGLPTGLELEPNAIQRLDGFMSIEVSGIPEGEKVWLAVLQDCDDDKKPDFHDRAACRSPLYGRWSRPAERNAKVRDRFIFKELAQELAAMELELPPERVLWLRASRTKSGPGRTARFGLVENPCTLWETVVDAFLRGKCNPGLAQSLRQHRGPSGLEDVTFEVRLVTLQDAAESRPVPATRGATGVAWFDERALLVTMGPTVEETNLLAGVEGIESSEPKDKPTGLTPGLYRIPLDGSQPELLWAPAEGDYWMPTAPLRLPDGSVAFVRQRLSEQVELTGAPEAFLHTLRNGRLDQGIALSYKAHQLLASDADGRSILVLTLGLAASKPAFLVADLTTGEVGHIGYHHSLYQAAMRSPTSSDAVVAMEDNSDRYGWDLVMVDERGQWKRDLVNRLGLHELLPAWRPDGGEVAFLAEIEGTRRRW